MGYILGLEFRELTDRLGRGKMRNLGFYLEELDEWCLYGDGEECRVRF